MVIDTCTRFYNGTMKLIILSGSMREYMFAPRMPSVLHKGNYPNQAWVNFSGQIWRSRAPERVKGAKTLGFVLRASEVHALLALAMISGPHSISNTPVFCGDHGLNRACYYYYGYRSDHSLYSS